MVEITRGQDMESIDLQNEAYETMGTSLSALLQAMMKKVAERGG